MNLSPFQKGVSVVVLAAWLGTFLFPIFHVELPPAVLVSTQGVLMIVIGRIFGVGLARKNGDES